MIAALLLGAVAGLDRGATGRTVLSEPVVLAALAALTVGGNGLDPRSAVTLAVILGMLASAERPEGHARPQDWATVAVVLPVVLARSGGGALAAVLLCAVAPLAAEGAGWTLYRLRLALSGREAAIAALAPAARIQAIVALQRRMVGVHALRGALLAGLGVLVLTAFVGFAKARLGPVGGRGAESVWALAPLAALPLLLRAHRRRSSPIPWIAGALVAAGAWWGGRRG